MNNATFNEKITWVERFNVHFRSSILERFREVNFNRHLNKPNQLKNPGTSGALALGCSTR
jgi:hypothetical protein